SGPPGTRFYVAVLLVLALLRLFAEGMDNLRTVLRVFFLKLDGFLKRIERKKYFAWYRQIRSKKQFKAIRVRLIVIYVHTVRRKHQRFDRGRLHAGHFANIP